MADYGKLLVNVTTDTGQFPIQNARVTIYVIETTIPVNRQLLEGEQRVDEQSMGQQQSEGVSAANPESRMEGNAANSSDAARQTGENADNLPGTTSQAEENATYTPAPTDIFRQADITIPSSKLQTRLNDAMFLENLETDESGQTREVELETPPLQYSEAPNEPRPYKNYILEIQADGYETALIIGVEMFPDVTAIQNVQLRNPETGRALLNKGAGTRVETDAGVNAGAEAIEGIIGEEAGISESLNGGISFNPGMEPDAGRNEVVEMNSNSTVHLIIIPPHTLYREYPPKIPESEIKPIDETGEIVLSRVVIPEYIIVHDGVPSDTSAPNYYVRYKDYIKNVVSSEIYSTWPESTIYANTLAIMSFTLNRVYTEWYRNKGYNFTITSSTAYDQKWIYGRNIYSNINYLVDSIFANFVSRPGVRQPLFTSYCDGSRVSCKGLSQWGSKTLGEQGFSALQILRYYYGNDVYINTADTISGVPASWPGYNLGIGARGEKVRQLQNQLNRIGRNYPAIGQVAADGIYGQNTANAVRTFQRVFSLPVTGVVDYATWYEISNIYTAVARLSEP